MARIDYSGVLAKVAAVMLGVLLAAGGFYVLKVAGVLPEKATNQEEVLTIGPDRYGVVCYRLKNQSSLSCVKVQ